MSKRQFYFDSPQGEDERIAYTLNAAKWGSSSPGSVTVVVKDSNGSDVTGTLIPSGSASTSGAVITLPVIRDGTKGQIYRVEVKWVDTGNTYEGWGHLTFEE